MILTKKNKNKFNKTNKTKKNKKIGGKLTPTPQQNRYTPVNITTTTSESPKVSTTPINRYTPTSLDSPKQVSTTPVNRITPIPTSRHHTPINRYTPTFLDSPKQVSTTPVNRITPIPLDSPKQVNQTILLKPIPELAIKQGQQTQQQLEFGPKPVLPTKTEFGPKPVLPTKTSITPSAFGPKPVLPTTTPSTNIVPPFSELTKKQKLDSIITPQKYKQILTNTFNDLDLDHKKIIMILDDENLKKNLELVDNHYYNIKDIVSSNNLPLLNDKYEIMNYYYRYHNLILKLNDCKKLLIEIKNLKPLQKKPFYLDCLIKLYDNHTKYFFENIDKNIIDKNFEKIIEIYQELQEPPEKINKEKYNSTELINTLKNYKKINSSISSISSFSRRKK